MSAGAGTGKGAAVDAALGLAEDIAAGQLDPARLDAELAAACRSLVGVVVGPGDPLFGLQIDIARQTIACGGLTTDELREWIAVLDQRQGAQDGPGRPLAASNHCVTELKGNVTVPD
jgi:hypothetical protein